MPSYRWIRAVCGDKNGQTGPAGGLHGILRSFTTRWARTEKMLMHIFLQARCGWQVVGETSSHFFNPSQTCALRKRPLRDVQLLRATYIILQILQNTVHLRYAQQSIFITYHNARAPQTTSHTSVPFKKWWRLSTTLHRFGKPEKRRPYRCLWLRP